MLGGTPALHPHTCSPPLARLLQPRDHARTALVVRASAALAFGEHPFRAGDVLVALRNRRAESRGLVRRGDATGQKDFDLRLAEEVVAASEASERLVHARVRIF